MSMTEEHLDVLRLQAFQTNSEADRADYFNALNQWFQERHYRQLANSQIDASKNAEIARLRKALEWVVDSDPSVVRTADFHVDCKCHRCAMDNARAALAEHGEK